MISTTNEKHNPRTHLYTHQITNQIHNNIHEFLLYAPQSWQKNRIVSNWSFFFPFYLVVIERRRVGSFDSAGEGGERRERERARRGERSSGFPLFFSAFFVWAVFVSRVGFVPLSFWIVFRVFEYFRKSRRRLFWEKNRGADTCASWEEGSGTGYRIDRDYLSICTFPLIVFDWIESNNYCTWQPSILRILENNGISRNNT